MGIFIFLILFVLGFFLILKLFNPNKYSEITFAPKPNPYLKIVSAAQVDDMDGIEFEYYVQALLINQGYSAEVTRGSNDYGVDIIAKKDGDQYAIQVKRYSSSVSRRAVSDSVAGMKFYNCNKSMVITNNYFTKGASELALSNSCILIDRAILGKWIHQFQGNTSEQQDLLGLPVLLKKQKEVLSSERTIVNNGGELDNDFFYKNSSKFSNEKTRNALDIEAALIAKKEHPKDVEMQEYEYEEQLSSKKYMSGVGDLEIKAIAQKEYPNDYIMQEDGYKNQLSSKQYMQQVSDMEILKIAQNEYPDDYIMQEETYREQLNSKNYMQALSDSRKKRKAQIEFPNDYSMQEYEYRNS